ncbi:Crp/Fnr family transcriptional regulator [Gorillibacterium massiliense]|uniref:Crp/Fnr family transcriptional regulator n=1 Tax=Gorillibacterium massiliense TaxID=1280390 RepID=UPI001EE1C709|nr:Crp/Fnr family transcriptional regulator [Gorillibacterium massiliense]
MKENMSAEIADRLQHAAFPISLPKGEILVHAGDHQTELYFVRGGILRSYYLDRDGNDMTKHFLEENAFCGSESLIRQEPSTCCIEALEDSEILAFHASDIKNLIRTFPYCMNVYAKGLEAVIRYKMDREISFLVKSATERYLDFKRMHPQLEKRVNQAYIASYIGITPISLSRIRRTIREEGTQTERGALR